MFGHASDVPGWTRFHLRTRISAEMPAVPLCADLERTGVSVGALKLPGGARAIRATLANVDRDLCFLQAGLLRAASG